MMSNLANKVAIVTGGTSGIGRASAIALAAAGAKVVVAGRRAQEGAEVERTIRDAGGEVLFVPTDVTDAAQQSNLIAQTVDRFGRLDIAFNNAGVEGQLGPFAEQGEENFDLIFDVNVKGLWRSMQYQIKQFLSQGDGGSIINTASVAGLVGFPGGSIYTASKHAVLGLTKTAALEFASSGIRVNAVSPGAIETEMYDRFTGGNSDVQAQVVAMHPLGRAGKAAEVADAVVFLAGENSSFVTGQSITVDGGYTAQ